MISSKLYDKSYCWNLVFKSVYIIFEELHIVRSVAIDAYLGSYPFITFDTYSWDTLCEHATMAQFVKYKFYDPQDISVAITQFTVCNSPSNPTSELRVGLENINILPDQVKSLLDDFTKIKSNQKSMYDMMCKIKDTKSLN